MRTAGATAVGGRDPIPDLAIPSLWLAAFSRQGNAWTVLLVRSPVRYHTGTSAAAFEQKHQGEQHCFDGTTRQKQAVRAMGVTVKSSGRGSIDGFPSVAGRPFRLVDADTHVNEPPDLWVS